MQHLEKLSIKDKLNRNSTQKTGRRRGYKVERGQIIYSMVKNLL